ncbi:sulfotransferase [Nonomuraea sp. KC401]|uniref:sulfotransferase family protein n=1 Tax=unclassified Nonomuraea TaxID=2593643 RepID=UPI0010FDEF31|nr:MULTISPECIES: sulfotransferase [unclassified Nonomuraea]NBE94224.1 sulfotransferase [Nonomuraea sp. K271]TLF77878.1 sulfotransferase [Nonomuraea sp. KC401]
MRLPPHILVVNGIKVRRPVFLLGAPHSGTDLLARALKRSPGFHVTMGRASLAHVVYAFARKPSLAATSGAVRVMRDALAESWQVLPRSCGQCAEPCRDAGGVTGAGPCVNAGDVTRFGDGSPDLLYSVPVLLQAFPDARFVQLIRDGRDVVAGMLADPACLTWFKPAMVTGQTEFPNAFFGISKDEHLDRWREMPDSGKSALRWRSAVRVSAELRRTLPEERLLTLRYEDLVLRPPQSVATLTEFLQTRVSKVVLYDPAVPMPGAWRSRLTRDDVKLVEKVAREELKRLGYLRKK